MRRRAALLFSGVGALGAVGLEVLGCEDPYTPPCRVERDALLVDDLAIGIRPMLVRSRTRVTASWPRRDVTDAGGISVSAIELAVLGPRGALGERTHVPAPTGLRARLDGVTSEGAVLEDGAALVHWIETTTLTDDRGRVYTNAALKVSYVRDDVLSDVDLPPSASCEHCTMTLAAAELERESVLFVRVDPQPTEVVFGVPIVPSFAALRVRRDVVVVDEPVPWLTASATPGDGGVAPASGTEPAPALSAYVDPEGRIGIATKDRAWLVDRALQVIEGPIVLPPSPDPRVGWDASGGASLVWSLSPFADGRSSSPNVVSDIFTGAVPPRANHIAARERLSSGRASLAVDRRGEDVGALFDSAARRIFVATDPRGRKRGGDLVLGAVPIERGGATAQSNVLLAAGDGRFTAIAFGAGELRATEIACAP